MRIMVVEDEPPILRDICGQIQQNGPEYTVIAQVSDGGLAIDSLKAGIVPDLVITDIQMPVMDGIALAEWLLAEYPQIPVVILTGYKEFEYARAALRLGVVDYLLKPVKPADLSILLRKTGDLLAERRYLAWHHAVEDAWRGASTAKSLYAGMTFGLVVIVAGTLSDLGEDILLPGAVFWEKVDLGKRLDDLVGRGGYWIADIQSPSEQSIILSLDEKSPAWLESVVRALHEWLSSMGMPIHLAACLMPLDLSRLRQGYAAMKRNLAQKAVIGQSCLCMAPNLERQESTASSVGYDADSEVLIARAAASRSADLLSATLVTLLRSWEQAHLPQVTTERYLKTLVTHIQAAAENDASRTLDIDQEIDNVTAGVLRFEDLAAPVAQLIMTVLALRSRADDDREDLIGQAEAFLRQHYTEPISGELLSKKIGIVPSYLSKLFRKRTGFSPPEFLIRLRIEKAQELLECNDQILIKDVARLVGYEDPNHFSRIFHKVCGRWPSEHRIQSKAGA